MYVLMEYKEVKNDGYGNKESSPVRVMDFSEDLSYFKDLNYVESLLKALGHVNTSRKYRKKFKVLLDLNHENCKSPSNKIREMMRSKMRDKKIDYVLSL